MFSEVLTLSEGNEFLSDLERDDYFEHNLYFHYSKVYFKLCIQDLESKMNITMIRK